MKWFNGLTKKQKTTVGAVALVVVIIVVKNLA